MSTRAPSAGAKRPRPSDVQEAGSALKRERSEGEQEPPISVSSSVDGEEQSVTVPVPPTELRAAENAQSLAQSPAPSGYRETRFPCLPCRQKGKVCYVARNKDIMPCSGESCQGENASACCADQRVFLEPSATPDMSIGTPTSDEMYESERLSLMRRVRVVMLEEAHADKIKVSGRWLEQDWTPISLAENSVLLHFHGTRSIYDSELRSDIDTYERNKLRLEEENKSLLKSHLPTITFQLGKRIEKLVKKEEEQAEHVTNQAAKLAKLESQLASTKSLLHLARSVIEARRSRAEY